MCIRDRTYTGSIHTTVGINIVNNPIPQDLGVVDRSIPGNDLIPEVSFQVGKKDVYKRQTVIGFAGYGRFSFCISLDGRHTL